MCIIERLVLCFGYQSHSPHGEMTVLKNELLNTLPPVHYWVRTVAPPLTVVWFSSPSIGLFSYPYLGPGEFDRCK